MAPSNAKSWLRHCETLHLKNVIVMTKKQNRKGDSGIFEYNSMYLYLRTVQLVNLENVLFRFSYHNLYLNKCGMFASK